MTTATPVKPATRHDRYADLLPIPALSTARCLIIGVGAIGHQLARLLSAMGINTLGICDHDTIEEANLGPQAWPEMYIGTHKVVCVEETCSELCNLTIATYAIPFSHQIDVENYDFIFSCVDKMEVRTAIFNAAINVHTAALLKHRKAISPRFFFDARMSAETCRILAVPFDEPGALDLYRSSLFSDAEAYTGNCTAKSTVYCATLAASLLCAQFTKSLRKFPLDPDMTFNLLSGEYFKTPPCSPSSSPSSSSSPSAPTSPSAASSPTSSTSASPTTTSPISSSP